MKRILLLFFCSLNFCSSFGQFPPQDTAFVKENYFKKEFRIPMRDGVTLFTAVYIPKDSSVKYPILYRRTPYSVGPYGENNFPGTLGPTLEYTHEKFIFAFQDVRGCFMSEGKFEDVRPYRSNKMKPAEIDESSDTWDSVDWLVKNLPSDNGRVGIYGISYPGFYTAAGIIDTHPAIKAASPQAPVSDWFHGDDFHHNGALFLPHAFNFYAVFGKARDSLTTKWGAPFDHGTPDGYKFFLKLGPLKNANEKYFHNKIEFWNQAMAHDTYDEFWKERNLNDHLRNIHCAVMTVGGWFDAENLYGALHVYRSIEEKNPGISNSIVMGPWSHGGWIRTEGNFHGDVSFGEKTSLYYQKEIEFQFFKYHLKQLGELNQPEAWVFETGINQWRKFDQWPPQKVIEKNIYLQSGEGISFTTPIGGAEYDEYVSDPAKPVPYMTTIANGMLKEYMSADQRFAATRQDVLVFQSPPLENSFTVAGPVSVNLNISTSGTDCDLIVKFIDVFPDSSTEISASNPLMKMSGYAQLLRGEPFRCKFRNSFENPEPMKPGEVTNISFDMPDIFHTFKPGHSIMIQVQSSWFPLVDRNPQKFVEINSCKDSDFIRATQRIYHSAKYPSHIAVKVLE